MKPNNVCGTGKAAVFHYTDYFGLAGIVSSKSLWCSKIQYLNDAQELRHGLQILAQTAKEFSKQNEELKDLSAKIGQVSGVNVFVCSFSEHGDRLSQWRGYTRGSGVSIAFSFEDLAKKAVLAGYQFVKCVYDIGKKRELARDYIRRMIENSGESPQSHDFGFSVVSGFVPIAARFKDPGFSEECEWRLISNITDASVQRVDARPTSSGVVPYRVFDLSTGEKPYLTEKQPWRSNEYICIEQVMIGPNNEQELQMNSVGYLFDAHDVAIPSVARSRIPYRTA